MREVVWVGVDAHSVERCRIAQDSDGVRAVSVVHSDEASCSYTLEATVQWHFRSLTIASEGRTVHASFLDGEWSVNGSPRRDLDAAREVDISASPLSNTLPIRRLRLAMGESADIVTAYVSVPDLDVVLDPQRYTRLSEREYLYESRDSDFRRSITVDEDGLVLDYPGLFERRVQGT